MKTGEKMIFKQISNQNGAHYPGGAPQTWQKSREEN